MTIHSLFENTVEQCSHRTAIISESRHISYETLNNRANQLSRLLMDKGIKSNDNIGIIMDKGIDMVITLLAILKAGAAYVPLEPDYPKKRIEYIVNNANISMLIVHQELDVPCNKLNINDYDVSLYEEHNVNISKKSTELAYIIYTSGSTGVPKGVMIQHNSVANLIHWVNEEFSINKHDKLLWVTSICFDLSVYDIFGILIAGGTIVIAKKDQVKNPHELITLISNEEITIWNSVPTTMDFLIKTLTDNMMDFDQKKLKYVFLSGDWIPVSLPDKIKSYFSRSKVISLGGATEATVWSVYYPIDTVEDSWNSIPYGIPIANTSLYVLDNEGNTVTPGDVGELYIGGAGVAQGYINDEIRTSESFITDRFSKSGSAKVYKTGDLVRALDYGVLEFLGRIDHQVKIRGYRVETNEVENSLLSFNGVEGAIVSGLKDESNNRYLCGYILTKARLSIQKLKKHLSSILPEYMIPSVFVQLETWPLNENGKINRKELPQPRLTYILSDVEYMPPANDVEKKIVRIWEKVLGLTDIGVHHNFFDIGGSSVLSVRLEAEYEKSKIPLNLENINALTTIKDQAQYLLDVHQPKKSTSPSVVDVENGHSNMTQELSYQQGISKEKVIEPIEAFNDVFYKNCFYHSLFPIVKHFDRNIEDFLVNNIGVYGYNEDVTTMNLHTRYIANMQDGDICHDIGIVMKAETQVHNVIKSITNALDQHRLVVLFVDSFYEPCRIDTYHKMHWPHTLLVNGYNESSRLFNIIEHRHQDALSYRKTTIGFEDIIEAYRGYIDKFTKNDDCHTYIEYGKGMDEEMHNHNYQLLFKENVEKHYNCISEGIDTIDMFHNHYKNLVYNGVKNILPNIPIYIKGLNQIIDNRKVERYKINKILGNEEILVNTLSHIIRLWSDIRHDIIKTSVNHQFHGSTYKGHLDKIKEIYRLEKRYLSDLCHMMKITS